MPGTTLLFPSCIFCPSSGRFSETPSLENTGRSCSSPSFIVSAILRWALDDTRMGLTLGLTLIALGAGGIKPCVSAIVGDQFGASNQHLLTRVFSWFYFAINFGSTFSTLLIPWLLDNIGPKIAFATPGLFMVLATLVFWFGRRKFVRVPPVGARIFLTAIFRRENLGALWNLLMLVPFVAMFWALWQQNFSSWVVQSTKMDRHLFGVEWLPAQIQTVNQYSSSGCCLCSPTRSIRRSTASSGSHPCERSAWDCFSWSWHS